MQSISLIIFITARRVEKICFNSVKKFEIFKSIIYLDNIKSILFIEDLINFRQISLFSSKNESSDSLSIKLESGRYFFLNKE